MGYAALAFIAWIAGLLAINLTFVLAFRAIYHRRFSLAMLLALVTALCVLAGACFAMGYARSGLNPGNYFSATH
jgi:hypothetical protein